MNINSEAVVCFFKKAIFVVIAGFAVYAVNININKTEKTTQHKDVVAKVTVETAKFVNISDDVSAIGTAIANESVVITSTISKKVTNILFEDGQYINAGDLLVQIDSSHEEAEKNRAELNATEQEREFNRLMPLKKNGVVSEKEYEVQRTKMLSARADLDLAKAKLNDTKIKAPFDGILGMRKVSVGSLINAGTPITTIDDIKIIKVDFTIPEKYIFKIKAGHEIVAKSESSKDKNFYGKIIAISPQINDVSHNTEVRAIFKNDERLLMPGMLLKISIALSKRSAICVPERALLCVDKDSYIFVINNKIASKRIVKTGTRINGLIEITNGLSAGEMYVLDGIISLKDGMAVDILNFT